MADITITVPQNIVQALRLPPDTVAAAFPEEMTRWEWEELLGARKIPRHYADEDLDRDIAYAARS